MWPGLRFGDGKSSLDGAGEAGSIHPHPDPLPPGERGVRPHPNPLPEGEGQDPIPRSPMTIERPCLRGRADWFPAAIRV